MELLLILWSVVIGSFLNVFITRYPLDKSLLTSSSCNFCKTKIKYYNNIPIISFLLLKGKSKCCNRKINIRYLIVEIITPLVSILILSLPIDLKDKILLILLSYLLIITFYIDWEHHLIFLKLNFLIFLIGLIFSFDYFSTYYFIHVIISSSVGFLMVFCIRWFYLKTRNIEAIGLGDGFYLVAMGSWLPILYNLYNFILGSVLALFFAVIFQKKNLQAHIPLGSYLAISSFILIIDTNYFHLLDKILRL